MYEPIPDIIALKQVLETLKCYEHQIQPVIIVTGCTMIIKCCCAEFRKECGLLAEELNTALEIRDLVFE